MELVLSGASIKLFSKAVNSLAKIGSDILFEVMADDAARAACTPLRALLLSHARRLTARPALAQLHQVSLLRRAPARRLLRYVQSGGHAADRGVQQGAL